MIERVPHILKTCKTTRTPSSLLFFDTETRNVLRSPANGEQKHRLWFGHAIAYRYENAQRTRFDDCTFRNVYAFWDFVCSRLDKKRPLTLYAHNAYFDLTICDFWRISEEKSWKIEYAVLASPPLILSIGTRWGRFNVVDTLNYFKVPLKTLGESVGLPKIEIDIEKATFEDALPYCKRDVDILSLSVDRLIDFVRTNDLGNMGSTVASLALSAYRHKFMDYDIYLHDRRRVQELEEKSYHGGYVNCAYVGKVHDKQIYKYDVNSLYPSVMLRDYPVKLLYALNDPSVSFIESEGEKKGIIADVTVNCTCNPLPVINKKELVFALGRFRTILVGPELQLAIEQNAVTRCHYAAFYELKPIFKRYVEYFWNLRAKYKADGDLANSTLAKYLLNSLYGKFAQGHYEWLELTSGNVKAAIESLGMEFPELYANKKNLPKMKKGQRTWIPYGVEGSLNVRRLGNLQQVQKREGVHPESFVGIASYVTSYARRYLMELIAIAGDRHVFYWDTDSLFVDETGRRNLKRAGVLSDTELGKLKLEGKEYEPTFLAPKDYSFGNDVCLKGVRKNARRVSKNRFVQLQFEGLAGVIRRGYEPFIRIKSVAKNVTHRYKKGRINPDGFTRPFHLPEER